MIRHNYTLDDMCAIAEARGCSYGVVQSHLYTGAPWPRLKKSVKWPRGSIHRGEMQLDANGQEISVPPPEPTEQPEPPKKREMLKNQECTVCGSKTPSNELSHITYHRGTSKNHIARQVGNFCRGCFSRLLPETRPTRAEMYPKVDENGNKVDGHLTARCFRCRTFYPRAEGGTIYREAAEDSHKLLSAYLCPDCFPIWLDETKKIGCPELTGHPKRSNGGSIPCTQE